MVNIYTHTHTYNGLVRHQLVTSFNINMLEYFFFIKQNSNIYLWKKVLFCLGNFLMAMVCIRENAEVNYSIEESHKTNGSRSFNRKTKKIWLVRRRGWKLLLQNIRDNEHLGVLAFLSK